jgi:hypothetical protein
MADRSSSRSTSRNPLTNIEFSHQNTERFHRPRVASFDVLASRAAGLGTSSRARRTNLITTTARATPATSCRPPRPGIGNVEEDGGGQVDGEQRGRLLRVAVLGVEERGHSEHVDEGQRCRGHGGAGLEGGCGPQYQIGDL